MFMATNPDLISRSGTQSLQRAAALLRALMVGNREGASTAELAARASIERTTAHRMLKCLSDEGLVSQDASNKRFYLGPLAYEMGIAAAERTDLRAICKPTLVEIAEDTGDTVFFMIRSGDDSVCIERAEGSYPVKTFVVDIGTRRPIGIGANSLAVLAALPAAEAELVLARNAPRICAYAGMSVEAVHEKMLKARAQGHVAVDVMGLPGVRAVAVPVQIKSGRVIAGLSIAAVQLRMTPARESVLIARLHRHAEKLGAAFSHAT